MRIYQCSHKESATITISAVNKLAAATAYAMAIGLDPDFWGDLREIKVILVEFNNLGLGVL